MLLFLNDAFLLGWDSFLCKGFGFSYFMKVSKRRERLQGDKVAIVFYRTKMIKDCVINRIQIIYP